MNSMNCEFILSYEKAHLSKIYEDILFGILHHSSYLDINQTEMNCEAAIKYIRDVFAITEEEHNKILERVKSLQPPEMDVYNEDNTDDMNSLLKFSLLSPKQEKIEDIMISYKILLKLLIYHELKSSRVSNYRWMGEFSLLSSKILSIYAEMHFLDEIHINFAKWIAYASVHQTNPINLQNFSKLLDVLIEDVNCDDGCYFPNTFMSLFPKCLPCTSPEASNHLRTIENYKDFKLKINNFHIIKLFWDATEKLHFVFLEFIENLHNKSNKINKIEILTKTLEIVTKIDEISQPNYVELNDFWILMENYLTNGTVEHLSANIKHENLKFTNCDEDRLDELIRVMKIIQKHLQSMLYDYSELLDPFLKCSLQTYLYKIYDNQLSQTIKPIVNEICMKIKVDEFKESDESAAMKLFELYKELKKFSDYGLKFTGQNNFNMKDYPNWFTGGLDKWTKFSIFTALSRINKSIEVDNLKPELEHSKCSSSAMDTMQVLYSVKRFWEQIEMNYSEIAIHVAGDFCSFAKNYFDKFSKKVKKIHQNDAESNDFIFPSKIPIAVANFDYILEEIQKLIYGMVKNMKNIQNLIKNTLEYKAFVVNQLLESALQNAMPNIRKLMLEKLKSETVDNCHQLLTFIDEILKKLSSNLSENDFNISVLILWKFILIIISDFLDSITNQHFKQNYIVNLSKMFNTLKDIFIIADQLKEDAEMSRLLMKVEKMLLNHSLDTQQLIHQYYKDRCELQDKISEKNLKSYGSLTIRCFFIQKTLNLEILNARKLIPTRSNNKCNPFVKINIMPMNFFQQHQNFKTKHQKNTHFPLFDEKFQFELTNEQRNAEDAILVFSVRHRLLLTSNEVIAEAFLPFKDIPEYSNQNTLKMFFLELTKVKNHDLESLQVLKVRSQIGDKIAKDFWKFSRSKSYLK